MVTEEPNTLQSRPVKKRNHRTMGDSETHNENGNVQRKGHSKKRRLDSTADCSSQNQKETEGFVEVKHHTKKRKGNQTEDDVSCKKRTKVVQVRKVKKHRKQKEMNDGKDTKTRNTEYKQHPIVNAKKRKTEETEEHERQAKKRKIEDSGTHERQTNKRKAEGSEEQERQTKKKKTGDSKDQERQAKKQHTDDSKDRKRKTKKRRTKDSRSPECQVKESMGESVEGMLCLQVKAERVIVQRRNVSEFCRIDIEKSNHVEGTVRGHPCTVLLDSGAMVSIVGMSEALRMGLVTGTETNKEKRQFNMQCGIVTLDVIKLREVVITLKGGVEVNTPIQVFPQEMDYFLGSRLVLSMHRLEEAGIVQQFNPDGSSSLFLRHPERLRQRPSVRKGNMYVFNLRKVDSAEPLTMVVDTGDHVVLAASKESVTRLTGKSTDPPPKILLQFERGADTVLDLVYESFLTNMTYDFMCGRGLLYSCSAVMDFIDHTITLRLGRIRLYKFAFYSDCSGVRTDQLSLAPLLSTHTQDLESACQPPLPQASSHYPSQYGRHY